MQGLLEKIRGLTLGIVSVQELGPSSSQNAKKNRKSQTRGRTLSAACTPGEPISPGPLLHFRRLEEALIPASPSIHAVSIKTGVCTEECGKPVTMLARNKEIALLLLAVAVTSLVLLAMSLPGLELRAGSPFPSGSGRIEPHAPAPPGGVSPSWEYSNSWLKGILALVFLLALFRVLYEFITRLDWKRLLWSTVLLIVLLAALMFIPAPPTALPVTGEPAILESIPEGEIPVSPLGEPPQLLVRLILGILVLAVLSFLAWLFLRRTRPTAARDPILQEAETAVNAMRAGMAFNTVILRCYLHMSRILQEEQGIKRKATMTAREFMYLLQERGVSAAPVRQLTLLFEAARYGALQATKSDEQIGIACLQEIVRDCRRGGT